METQSVLTNRTFKSIQNDNSKLGTLNESMKQMSSNYQDMKRKREEQLKQLNQKFEDINLEIETTKEYIAKVVIVINQSFNQFQQKSLQELEDKSLQFQLELNDHKQNTQQNLNHLRDILQNLDQKLDEEIVDRKKENQDTLELMNSQIKDLNELHDDCQHNRILNHKNIIQQVKKESSEINNRIVLESQDRDHKSNVLQKDVQYELDMQNKLNEQFHAKTLDEYSKVTSNLGKEMNNRFDHQDKIVSDLTLVISTIQKTLKILGQEA